MSPIDPRLTAILACMSGCSSIPVTGPPENSTIDKPRGTVVRLVPLSPVRSAPFPQDPAQTYRDLRNPTDAQIYEMECRERAAGDQPCRIDEMVFPTDEAIRSMVRGLDTARITWTVHVSPPTHITRRTYGPTLPSGWMAGLNARVVWTTGWDGSSIHDCTVDVDPTTGVVTDQSCRTVTAGRPVGPAHRCSIPSDLHGRARRWARLAADEDEAVQAFHIHVEELRTLGAPVDLVSRAQAAQRDEERHREIALERAAFYAGRPVQLGTRPTPAHPRVDRMEVLLSVARDGAVNETMSYCALLVEAEACDDPVDRQLLLEIAGDEARHAALAWDTLRWAWPTLDPAQRDAVLEATRFAVQVPSLLGYADELGDVVGTDAREHVVAPLRDLLAREWPPPKSRQLNRQTAGLRRSVFSNGTQVTRFESLMGRHVQRRLHVGGR